MIGQFLHCRLGRSRLATSMLGLLFLVVMVYTGPAADPPQRLTPEQRKELERQATELSNAVVQHYQRGELGLALDKARQRTVPNFAKLPEVQDRIPTGSTCRYFGEGSLGSSASSLP